MTGEGAITRRMHAVHLASTARLRMAREGRRLTSAEWVEVAEDVRRRLGMPLPSPLRRGACDVHGDDCGGCGFMVLS